MIYIDPIIPDNSVRWLSTGSIQVRFTSTHTTRLHQLYAGRQLLAESTSVGQRVLEGQLVYSVYPQYLRVVAVDGIHVGVDNGAQLPPGPYNVVKVQFDESGWSGSAHELDVQYFGLYRGNSAGGAISYTSPVAKVLAEPNGLTYEMKSDPLPGSGTWNLGIRGIDTTERAGNAGTAEEFTADVTAIPPDFQTTPIISVAGGTATILATLPTD